MTDLFAQRDQGDNERQRAGAHCVQFAMAHQHRHHLGLPQPLRHRVGRRIRDHRTGNGYWKHSVDATVPIGGLYR